MIMAQEQAILNGQTEFDQLADYVRQAGERDERIDLVELAVFRGLLRMGLALTKGFVAGQGTGDLGKTFEHEGRTLRRLKELHDRRYVSVFGHLPIRRHVYGTRETQKLEVAPLDARIGLPKDDYSNLLKQWNQSFCVRNSYEESRSSMEQILGLKQSVRALEYQNQQMAQSVEGFRQRRQAPPAREEGSILVFTGDGKGVPMRRQADEPAPAGRLKRGEKANKKKMAIVGAVYTIDPFVRTADEVVDEVMRERPKNGGPSPNTSGCRRN